MRFEWDPAKEEANLAKHGVDFTTAQVAFADPKALVLLDDSHGGKTELRWWLLGKVGSRVMLVRYTPREREPPLDWGRILEGGTRLL